MEPVPRRERALEPEPLGRDEALARYAPDSQWEYQPSPSNPNSSATMWAASIGNNPFTGIAQSIELQVNTGRFRFVDRGRFTNSRRPKRRGGAAAGAEARPSRRSSAISL